MVVFAIDFPKWPSMPCRVVEEKQRTAHAASTSTTSAVANLDFLQPRFSPSSDENGVFYSPENEACWPPFSLTGFFFFFCTQQNGKKRCGRPSPSHS